jgi:hypothetical protein
MGSLVGRLDQPVTDAAREASKLDRLPILRLIDPETVHPNSSVAFRGGERARRRRMLPQKCSPIPSDEARRRLDRLRSPSQAPVTDPPPDCTVFDD